MFPDIPSATLKKLVKLSERKEALMAQIQDVDREMARLQGKSQVPVHPTTLPVRVTVSGQPGRRNSQRGKRAGARKKS